MEVICLHAGGVRLSADELRKLSTPAPTLTHVPISHSYVYDSLKNELSKRNWEVMDEDLAVSNEGQRFFGCFQVKPKNIARRDDWSMLFGVRNAHDKRYKLSLAAGEQVFICDNLAFHGEATVERKHTSRILNDLPMLVGEAVGKLVNIGPIVELRNEHYQATQLRGEAGNLLIEMARDDIFPVREIVRIDDAYRKEQDTTAWGLKNAITAFMKSRPTSLIVGRSIKMHQMLDTVTGFNAEKALSN
jgi:hypothetical protein